MIEDVEAEQCGTQELMDNGWLAGGGCVAQESALGETGRSRGATETQRKRDGGGVGTVRKRRAVDGIEGGRSVGGVVVVVRVLRGRWSRRSSVSTACLLQPACAATLSLRSSIECVRAHRPSRQPGFTSSIAHVIGRSSQG
jgi:hypothetical protein